MPNLESLTLPIKVGNTKTNVKYDIPQGNVLQEDLEDYAKNNGYYDEFTAGSAEQLLSSQFVEDSVPYKYRTSGGSKDIGNREYDEIVGGSIVWNQLAITYGDGDQSGITRTKNADGSITMNGTTNTTPWLDFAHYKAEKSHVCLLIATNFGYLKNINGAFFSTNSVIGYIPSMNKIGADGTFVYMFKPTDTRDDVYLSVKVPSGTTVNNETSYVMNFDLTQMFGSQVADYIYSLESAEAGKGVAFFKSLFPNDYYPYNAGELLSVEGLQSHDTVGFNQWDEEWELGNIDISSGQNTTNANNIRSKNYIPVLPNTTYYLMCGVQATFNYRLYDSDKNYISGAYIGRNNTLTIPSGASYMRFYMGDSYGKVYNNDICINLSWSGWRNGEYEPYKKHSYPLDSSLTLRGIPKLNVQNELYFDGDIYSHDGKVDRRMFVRRFTKEDAWTKDSEHEYTFRLLLTTIPATEQPEGGLLKNATTHIYGGYKSLSSAEVGSVEGVYVNLTSALYVTVMSCSTLNEFKTWLDTNMLVLGYPITPTEETAEPYTSPQAVDDFGTEEYISGNVVPVGHNTQYPANLRDKLQHLPNLADNDGYYMISQQNKQMSLEVFRIPKAPTTDGTYTLKATVSGGTPTYVWESEETE